jgi:hypothetical protein
MLASDGLDCRQISQGHAVHPETTSTPTRNLAHVLATSAGTRTAAPLDLVEHSLRLASTSGGLARLETAAI